MSPATAVIAVERYIGSCLISSSPPYVSPAYNMSKKDRIGAGAYRFPSTAPAPIRDFYRQPPPGHHQPPPPWILPPPSPSNGIRRHKDDVVRRSPKDTIVNNNKEDLLNRSPLSRLAIHTQGAPLIQAQRQNNRKPSNNNIVNKNNKQHNGSVSANNNNNSKSVVFTGTRVQEETSNENCLPRIIKPRKRRKKDRKPSLPSANPESSIVTLKPYTPLCQEFDDGPKEKSRVDVQQKSQRDVKPDEVPDHGAPDVVNETDEEPHRCCCRYCDPAGSVWDSPTIPLPSTSDEWSTLQVSSEIITSPNGHRDIEIKFFSTAAPASPPQTIVAPSSSKSSISPPWP
ncbi:unnamed protein product [Nesidiocoris tenuis]|uniref:Uncharacterized protein n=1 Tax=Nesidiocoris tenuis TaxID=355587 RepID=A0A6H5HJ32_9HEMI|nr:unnamed protein product [Nesidiocoris tenuis]